MAQKDVKISFSGRTITVDKDKVQAKQNDDTVLWSGDGQFSIVLPSGAVTAAQINSKKWQATAGPWSAVGTIKYDVTAPNHDTLDPEVDVIP
jgi:hypothetical protein